MTGTRRLPTTDETAVVARLPMPDRLLPAWIAAAMAVGLFLCVHNAGRSQMAAALLDHHAAGRLTVRSAGSALMTGISGTRSTPW